MSLSTRNTVITLTITFGLLFAVQFLMYPGTLVSLTPASPAVDDIGSNRKTSSVELAKLHVLLDSMNHRLSKIETAHGAGFVEGKLLLNKSTNGGQVAATNKNFDSMYKRTQSGGRNGAEGLLDDTWMKYVNSPPPPTIPIEQLRLPNGEDQEEVCGEVGDMTNFIPANAVCRLLARLYEYDTNRDALLCSGSEINSIDSALGKILIPEFDRLSETPQGVLCKKVSQIETHLYRKLAWVGGEDVLRKLAIEHGHPVWSRNTRSSYKYQGVTDFSRRVPWPYTSQEAYEGIATLIYHGENSPLSRWSAADVRAGDIISVREHIHTYFAKIEPLLTVPHVLIVLTEAEDVAPGRFAGQLRSPYLIRWYSINLNRKRNEWFRESPKLRALPLGHVWRTNGDFLRTNAMASPPVLDDDRENMLIVGFSLNTNKNRKQEYEYLSNLAGSKKYVAPSGFRYPLAHMLKEYSNTKFVPSPHGAGFDCHRTWEALVVGAVPIVPSHPGLDELFEPGDPVWVVSSFKDINESSMAKFIHTHKGSSTPKSMYAQVWWAKLVADSEVPVIKDSSISNVSSSVAPHRRRFDLKNIHLWPSRRAVYRTKLVENLAECSGGDDSLASLVNPSQKNRTWRVTLSSDENPNYLAYWPSVAAMWKKFGAVPSLALVSTSNEDDIKVLPFLRKYGDVVVLKAVDDPEVPFGHQAKLGRSYLATQFPEDVVTIGDLDHYIFNINWLRKAVLDCGQENQLVGIGWNMYKGNKVLTGKYPMYFSTARGDTFQRFLNPEVASFDDFIHSLKGLKHFDTQENPWQKYGGFSDESVFRVLLSNAFHPDADADTHVVWISRREPYRKRVDRGSTEDMRNFSPEKMNEYFDVFPNRPLANCDTYTKRLSVVHKHLGIFDPFRDAQFLDLCKAAGLLTKDWGQKGVGGSISQDTIDCIRNVPS